MDVQVAFRNVVHELQSDPSRYKLFGVYWWPLKKLLKAAGYGPDQLYMLRDYQDARMADDVPPAGLEETLREAFVTYQQNLCYPHSDGRVELPDGEMVTMWDEDAGI